jgi:hypothetical protein
MTDMRQRLMRDGYLIVPYPSLLKSRILIAMRSLPQGSKDSCAIGDENLRDLGYSFRSGTGTFADQKEFFHIWKAALPEVSAALKRSGVMDTLFSTLTEHLALSIAPLLQGVAMQLEEACHLSEIAREISSNLDKCTFRFIHYLPGRTSGSEIAHAHADKSGFTLHLYESEPGLECYWDQQWRPMPVSDEQTVIIPGLALQYRSECMLKATFHRVVATPEAARNGRFALVCFIPLMNTPVYDTRYGPRLQEMPVGFNYKMPFSEFKTLFRDP